MWASADESAIAYVPRCVSFFWLKLRTSQFLAINYVLFYFFPQKYYNNCTHIYDSEFCQDLWVVFKKYTYNTIENCLCTLCMLSRWYLLYDRRVESRIRERQIPILWDRHFGWSNQWPSRYVSLVSILTLLRGEKITQIFTDKVPWLVVCSSPLSDTISLGNKVFFSNVSYNRYRSW